MDARTIMIQGTASNAGKSFLVTALCRIFRQDGWRVAPFKSQNMSNNSCVTPDGLEIGRAQGEQATAAGLPASADMNPVLLKPCGGGRSQVVIHGRPYATMDFRAYRREGFAPAARAIRDSLTRLRALYDLVVIEGAGSPAEVNLRDRELVNMRIAAWAEAPVLLVADIDRGGALASLVGTLALLEPDEERRVAGLVINKFRGDPGLLRPAVEFLEQRTGKPVLGVVPYLNVDLQAEDSLVLAETPRPALRSVTEPEAIELRAVELRIAALRLPLVSNFTDLAPLQGSPGVAVQWVDAPAGLAGADAVIIPGSKNTAEDLRWLWQTGLGAAVQRLAARGVPVAGICGGYQMLGRRLIDPGGHESNHEETPGLGLLDVETEFAPAAAKVTARTDAVIAFSQGPFAACAGARVSGYQIRMGRTRLGPGARSLFRAGGPQDGPTMRGGPRGGPVDHGLGAADPAGQVWGTYLHDVFQCDALRSGWLSWLWRRRGLTPPRPLAPSEGGAGGADDREESFNRLAAGVRAAMDMEGLYSILGLAPR